jgi:hypothetical protein
VKTWDPFFIASDFMYGSYNSNKVAPDASSAKLKNDRSGWAFATKAGYKFEELTPTVFGWYGSGGRFDGDKQLDGLMPVLKPEFGFTSFGWANNYGIFRDGIVTGRNIVGTWGLGLGLEDIKVVDGLTNSLRVAYFRGTNHKDVRGLLSGTATDGKNTIRSLPIGSENGYLLGSKDWGVEVNLDNEYKIMDGLLLYNSVGYVHTNIANYGGEKFETSDAWQFAVGFRYNF